MFAGLKLNAQLLITKDVCVKFDQTKPYCFNSDSVYYDLEYITVMLKQKQFQADWKIKVPAYDSVGCFAPVEFSKTNMIFNLTEGDENFDISKFLYFCRFVFANYYSIDTAYVNIYPLENQ
jgi:hypothetical protein